MKTSQKGMPSESGELESLLKFTTMASVFINSILKKPLKSKRKVNHRKFLQKQLGAYSQYKSIFINNSDKEQDPVKYFCHLDPSAIQESAEEKRGNLACVSDGLEEQSLAKLFNPDVWESKAIGRESMQNCSLRNRQFPQSFWKEPKIYNSTTVLLRTDHSNSSQNEAVETFDFFGVEFDELLEKLSETEDSDVLSTSSGRCTSLSDSCSIGGIEPETPSSINSDSPGNLSKCVYDEIWNVPDPADIVNLTHSNERYFF